MDVGPAAGNFHRDRSKHVVITKLSMRYFGDLDSARTWSLLRGGTLTPSTINFWRIPSHAEPPLPRKRVLSFSDAGESCCEVDRIVEPFRSVGSAENFCLRPTTMTSDIGMYPLVIEEDDPGRRITTIDRLRENRCDLIHRGSCSSRRRYARRSKHRRR